MFCTNCGAELLEGSRFCTMCGAPVESAEDDRADPEDAAADCDTGGLEETQSPLPHAAVLPTNERTVRSRPGCLKAILIGAVLCAAAVFVVIICVINRDKPADPAVLSGEEDPAMEEAQASTEDDQEPVPEDIHTDAEVDSEYGSNTFQDGESMDAWYCPIDEADMAVLEGWWASEYGGSFLYIHQDGPGIIIEEYDGEREMIDRYSYNDQSFNDSESLMLDFSSLVYPESETTVCLTYFYQDMGEVLHLDWVSSGGHKVTETYFSMEDG